MPSPPQTPTRREFLKRAGLAAAGVPLLFNQSVPTRRRHSCVVVGAGLSGLAAAHALRRADWDVTVLEARDRVGGRVFSYSFPESPDLVCELGGEWVGASHERMQALCREFGVALKDHRFEATLMRDGKVSRPGQWDFSPQAQAAWEKFRKQYHALTPRGQRRLDGFDWWTWLEEIGFTPDDLLLRDLQDSTDFGESI
ncbi:MAG TPA: FAD-dependent oxidoreductase, partial [Pyrinomonadaceae bacterium]|nr:FAD-dependent oxidoreductase [Pyrinomonadaceae bacterium]